MSTVSFGHASSDGPGSLRWSGRRDSNPRPTAWKAVTLPLSYSRIQADRPEFRRPESHLKSNGGGGWIRTTVRIRGQIYSLLPLSTRPHLHEIFRCPGKLTDCWSRHPDLNRGPTDYKSVALPTELCRRVRRQVFPPESFAVTPIAAVAALGGGRIVPSLPQGRKAFSRLFSPLLGSGFRSYEFPSHILFLSSDPPPPGAPDGPRKT